MPSPSDIAVPPNTASLPALLSNVPEQESQDKNSLIPKNVSKTASNAFTPTTESEASAKARLHTQLKVQQLPAATKATLGDFKVNNVCPDWRTHPKHVLSEAAMQVYRRSGLLSSNREAYIRAGHSVGFYFAPHASHVGANALGMLMVWFFAVDDQIDDDHIQDRGKAEDFLDRIRDAFLRAKESMGKPIDTASMSELQKLTVEVHSAFLKLCENRPALYERFMDDLSDWLDSIVPFNFEFRTSERTDEAIACRMINIGAQATLIGMAIVNEVQLSLRLLNNPHAESARHIAFHHLTLQNDLVSYHSDTKKPERLKNNLLTVLMARNKVPENDTEQGLTLAERELRNMEEKIEMHINLMRTSCRTLPNEEVETYARLIYELVGGSWGWSVEEARYRDSANIIPELRTILALGARAADEGWSAETAGN